MPWLKVSDTAAMHPAVLAPLADTCDDGLDGYDRANILFGLVVRCATLSAGYLTDYLVSDATIAQIAGARWLARAEAAERAGYWTRTPEGWLIVEDSTNLLHIRKGAEIEWERQRKKDTATPSLVIPVRLRDGDGCRYCGRIVVWGDQRGGRGGTYDHRIPGAPAKTADDLRVACRSCNAQRGNDPDADRRLPPLPVPATPFYGDKTRALLAEHGHALPDVAAARPGHQPDTAPRDPEFGTTRLAIPAEGHRDPATPPPAGPRTDDPATWQPAGSRIDDHLLSTNSANRLSTEFGSPGRDGQGREGKGRHARTASTRRRRARRGRRKH